MKNILLSGIVVAASNVCIASDFYAGADYSMLDTELKGYGSKVGTEPAALNFKLGKEFSKHFAAEAMLGVGLSDDKVEDSDFDFELDTLFGVAAVGLLPLNESAKLYGKVGFAKIDYDDSDGDSSDASGLLYGVGASVDLSSEFGVNIEYLQYPDGEYDDFDVDVETTVINLGAYVRF